MGVITKKKNFSNIRTKDCSINPVGEKTPTGFFYVTFSPSRSKGA